MTDIVKRLRELAAVDNCQASIDAADEIERLRERIRKLEERNSELSWTVYPDRMGR